MTTRTTTRTTGTTRGGAVAAGLAATACTLAGRLRRALAPTSTRTRLNGDQGGETTAAGVVLDFPAALVASPDLRQIVDTMTRPALVGLTGGRRTGGPHGRDDGEGWPDPGGTPASVHQVAEWAARVCDELAGLAEQGADRSADIHDALDRWDLTAATRAAMTQGVALHHIAGALGELHAQLDEIAHRPQLAGGAS